MQVRKNTPILATAALLLLCLLPAAAMAAEVTCSTFLSSCGGESSTICNAFKSAGSEAACYTAYHLYDDQTDNSCLRGVKDTFGSCYAKWHK